MIRLKVESRRLALKEVEGSKVIDSRRVISFSLLPLAFSLLLAACADPEPNYRLTSVLPSPVTPGEPLTAYGVLPAKATVSLNGTVLEATAIPGGLRFSVPPTFIAGSHVLRISQGQTQLGSVVQVLPRIDSAVLEGNVLHLTGAGWPTSGELTNTQVEVDAQRLNPIRENAGLQVKLSPTQSYGIAQVRIWVGSEGSESVSLLREAGALEGRVELPASGSSPNHGASLVSLTPNLSAKALIVFHTPDALNGLKLEGLLRQDYQPRLGATHLTFQTADQAQTAKVKLSQLKGIQQIELDQKAVVQGSEPILVPTPGQAGLKAQVTAAPTPPKGQWHLPLMGIPQAWERTQGEGIVVGVVDTGVVLDHPDLVGNLLPGYDFVGGDTQPNDTYGHGTHVAGLIAANGTVLGAAPKAKLLPVRALAGSAGGSTFDVAKGILWAAGLSNGAGCTVSAQASPTCNPNPARIINLSLGVEGGSTVIDQAVAQAQQAGVLVVAAAGNSGGYLASPASLPGVISVTALAGPKVAYQPWYANTGYGLQLTAYGGDTTQDQDGDGVKDGLLSTDLGSDGTPGYGLRMGTSMAAPLVSGLAALALSSGTPPNLVGQTLSNTATDLGVMGYDTRYGYGLTTGRTATATTPRVYTVALDSAHRVLAWTLVQDDLSYRLGNLPPGEKLTIISASDQDGDGVLGEAGEMISQALEFTATARTATPLSQLTLSPASGVTLIPLQPQK